MKTYAIGFLLAALSSACFIGGVRTEIAHLGKISVAIFTVLFVIAEGMVIFGT